MCMCVLKLLSKNERSTWTLQTHKEIPTLYEKKMREEVRVNTDTKLNKL